MHAPYESPYYPGQDLPLFVEIEHAFDNPSIIDVESATRQALNQSGVKLEAGWEVALTCGSRGIAKIAEITRAVGEWVKSQGGIPFIVPSMGSHGGCTAEGQREVRAMACLRIQVADCVRHPSTPPQVLESYGVTEEATGCQIRSSMEAPPNTTRVPRECLMVPVQYS